MPLDIDRVMKANSFSLVFLNDVFLIVIFITVKTNDKIRRFGVVMTPISRNDKDRIRQITYSI